MLTTKQSDAGTRPGGDAVFGESFTAMYRKGCKPPDSVTWSAYDNNARFLAQSIVMTVNSTLSIPNALKGERPDDYYDNTATIDWPDGASGQPLPIVANAHEALVFKDGEHVATAKEFVSFLSSEGWLAHYLDFSAERILQDSSHLSPCPPRRRPSGPSAPAVTLGYSCP
jgi:ABC-type glycerol-3-phosphate transport system substrate-binding protein